MAADQDRAERIKRLKLESQGLTWQQIADHCGVTMRAAQAWGETGEIAYANAKKLAELFDSTVDYIMRGRGDSPDLMGALRNGSQGQLDRMERTLNLILSRLPEPADDRLAVEAEEEERARQSERTDSEHAAGKHGPQRKAPARKRRA